MFLEGAKWNMKDMELEESDPKVNIFFNNQIQVLFTPCPEILLKPIYEEIPEFPHYACPIYKTSTRRGIILKNFVL